MADLAVALALPLIVVARDSLGTINHTLLTLEAAAARGLEVAAVILSGATPGTSDRDAARNAEEIARRGRVPVVGRLPHLAGLRADGDARASSWRASDAPTDSVAHGLGAGGLGANGLPRAPTPHEHATRERTRDAQATRRLTRRAQTRRARTRRDRARREHATRERTRDEQATRRTRHSAAQRTRRTATRRTTTARHASSGRRARDTRTDPGQQARAGFPRDRLGARGHNATELDASTRHANGPGACGRGESALDTRALASPESTLRTRRAVARSVVSRRARAVARAARGGGRGSPRPGVPSP